MTINLISFLALAGTRSLPCMHIYMQACSQINNSARSTFACTPIWVIKEDDEEDAAAVIGAAAATGEEKGGSAAKIQSWTCA